VNPSAKIGLLCLAVTLAACSSIESERIDYRSSTKAPSLDVPPDLTQLSRENRYAIPGGSVTASGYSASAAGPAIGPAIAANSLGDVHIERLGNQRWLVVGRDADKLWQSVHDFWVEGGFVLTQEQANLGIMETDWAENRGKLPLDFIRKAIGSALDSLYSTGERDKFRTRLERTPSGGTEIFISHRGMVEVYSSSNKDTTVWQPRPADPELEAEFLRRLMVKLGVPTSQAQAALSSPAAGAKPVATVSTINGLPGLEIADGFDRAWRRVGLALDRSGFTVEDRDRTQGTYFVRYVESGADKKEGNFFSKLFSSSDSAAALQKFRVILKSEGNKTTLTVTSATAAPEAAGSAKRIVQLIADDLK
jgi:outer membrane protein assembly factor BamC